LDVAERRRAIRQAIEGIAERQGNEASGLGDGDIIPEAGILDSMGILELVVWYERHFALDLAQSEITVANLGTIERMAEYVTRKRAGSRSG
jgi:acyl carrier protein